MTDPLCTSRPKKGSPTAALAIKHRTNVLLPVFGLAARMEIPAMGRHSAHNHDTSARGSLISASMDVNPKPLSVGWSLGSITSITAATKPGIRYNVLKGGNHEVPHVAAHLATRGMPTVAFQLYENNAIAERTTGL